MAAYVEHDQALLMGRWGQPPMVEFSLANQRLGNDGMPSVVCRPSALSLLLPSPVNKVAILPQSQRSLFVCLHGTSKLPINSILYGLAQTVMDLRHIYPSRGFVISTFVRFRRSERIRCDDCCTRAGRHRASTHKEIVENNGR